MIIPNLVFTIRHIFNLHAPGGPRGNYYATARERHSAYEWIRVNTQPHEVVAAHYAGEVYLVTSRHSIPYMPDSIPELPGEKVRWILASPEDGEGISEIIRAQNAIERWSSDNRRFVIYEFPDVNPG